MNSSTFNALMAFVPDGALGDRTHPFWGPPDCAVRNMSDPCRWVVKQLSRDNRSPELCEAWRREMLKDKEKARAEAQAATPEQRLAQRPFSSPEIRRDFMGQDEAPE